MYLAIKLYNQKSLTMKSLSALSRGEFSAVHIAEMECVILHTLSWNLYPPTSANFIYHSHTLLPTIKDSTKQTILQRSFAELAVMEYSFVTVNPSDIAFAAILNALDGLDVSFMSEVARISIHYSNRGWFWYCSYFKDYQFNTRKDLEFVRTEHTI